MIILRRLLGRYTSNLTDQNFHWTHSLRLSSKYFKLTQNILIVIIWQLFVVNKISKNMCHFNILFNIIFQIWRNVKIVQIFVNYIPGDLISYRVRFKFALITFVLLEWILAKNFVCWEISRCQIDIAITIMKWIVCCT